MHHLLFVCKTKTVLQHMSAIFLQSTKKRTQKTHTTPEHNYSASLTFSYVCYKCTYFFGYITCIFSQSFCHYYKKF